MICAHSSEPFSDWLTNLLLYSSSTRFSVNFHFPLLFLGKTHEITGWRVMGMLLMLFFFVRSLYGPMLTLLYPLHETVMAIESKTKVDDEQWLAYWILYSLLTLLEMILQPVLELIPIWYEVKLVFVAWLVLPQTKGAAFLYERFVREQIKKNGWFRDRED
ncbi:HVA22-like protein e [Corylus avellana]|uniref:HVA22-like protein e n=1 Tax=Corylus avellana TaxID=13451 RepID=UPI00286CE8E1|nr:HVA22-like protein e [Corylus avellana]